MSSNNTPSAERTKFIRSTRRLGQLFTSGAATRQLFHPENPNHLPRPGSLSRRNTISGISVSSQKSNSDTSSGSSLVTIAPSASRRPGSRSYTPLHLTIDTVAQPTSSYSPPQSPLSPSSSTSTSSTFPTPTATAPTSPPVPGPGSRRTSSSAAARRLKMDKLARTLGELPPAELVFPPSSYTPTSTTHTSTPTSTIRTGTSTGTSTPPLQDYIRLPQIGQPWSAPWEDIDPETWARGQHQTTQHHDPPSPTSTTHSREALLKKRPSTSTSATGTAGRSFWRSAGPLRRGSSSDDSLTHFNATYSAHSGLSVVRIASNDSGGRPSSRAGSRPGSVKSGVGGGAATVGVGYSGRVHVRELKYPVWNITDVNGGGKNEKEVGGDNRGSAVEEDGPTPRVNLRRATRMAHIFGHPRLDRDVDTDADATSLRNNNKSRRLNKHRLDARSMEGLAYMLDNDLDTLYELLSFSPNVPTADADGDPEWPYEDEFKRLNSRTRRAEKRTGKEREGEKGAERDRESYEKEGRNQTEKHKQNSTPGLTPTPLLTFPPSRIASLPSPLPLPTPPPTSRSCPATPLSPQGEHHAHGLRDTSPMHHGALPHPSTVTVTSLTSPPSTRAHATARSNSNSNSNSHSHSHSHSSTTPLATLQRRRAARLERVFRVSYRELFEYMVVFPEDGGEGEAARGDRKANVGFRTGSGSVPQKGGDGAWTRAGEGESEKAGNGAGGSGGREGVHMHAHNTVSGTGGGSREAPGKLPVSMMTVAAIAKVAAMAAGSGTTHQGPGHEDAQQLETRRDKHTYPTGGGKMGEARGSGLGSMMRSKTLPQLPMLPTHASTSIPTPTPTPTPMTSNSNSSKVKSALHRRSASLDLLTQMHVHGTSSGSGGGEISEAQEAREPRSGSTSTSTLASGSTASSSASSMYPSTPADGTAPPPTPPTPTPIPPHPHAHMHAKAHFTTTAQHETTQAADTSPHTDAPTTNTMTNTNTTASQHRDHPKPHPNTLLLPSPLMGSFRNMMVPPSPPPFAGYPAKEQLLGIGYGYGEYGYAAVEEGADGERGVEGLATGGRTTPTPAHALARQREHPSTTTAVHVQRKGVIKRVVSVSRARAGKEDFSGSVELKRKKAEDMEGVMNRLRELR